MNRRILMGYLYLAYGSLWLHTWGRWVTTWFCFSQRGTWRYRIAAWWISQAGYVRHPYIEVDIYEWRKGHCA